MDNAANPTNLLSQIKVKVAQLQQLNELVKAQLDSSLGQHCCVANVRDNILILEVDSSAWATRLRYLVPELLQKLRTHKELNRLQEIQWYIRPADINAQSVSRPLTLSQDNAELMMEATQHIANPHLQEVMKKLAKHVRKT